MHKLIKKKNNFPHIYENPEESSCNVIYDYGPSYMTEYLRISSYNIRKPFLIYDFATAPF
jgi:hypothetical protein